MSLNIEIFKDKKEAWDAYVNSHPFSTNYHQFDWKTVIEKTFGHKAYYFIGKDENQNICGILPLIHMKSTIFGNFLVSMPFLNYGGLLCNNETIESALIEKAEILLNSLKADFIELRHLKDHGHALITKRHKVTMVLELEKNTDLQWGLLEKKVRNQIRKATSSGSSIKIGHLDMLDDFYKVFSINMKDLGTPVYSKEFFKNILDIFPNSTTILTVFLKNKVIASGIGIWYKENFEVPWASSIKKYRPLCPNNLLYWEAIKYAINKGFKTFDFGRSTPGGGTYIFKEQWGAKPIQLYWQYRTKKNYCLSELNPNNPKYKLAIKIWKKLPLGLSKIIGPKIIKYIP